MSTLQEHAESMSVLYQGAVGIVSAISMALRKRSNDDVLSALGALTTEPDFQTALDRYGIDSVANQQCVETDASDELPEQILVLIGTCQSVSDALNGLHGALQAAKEKRNSTAAVEAVERAAQTLSRAAHELQMRTVMLLPRE